MTTFPHIRRLTAIATICVLSACASEAEPPPGNDAQAVAGVLQFDRSVLLEQEGPTSANVSIGDLDADGHLDIVMIDERHGPAILYGSATPVFGEPVPLGDSGPTPYSLALADRNEDGRMDILVGYVESHPVAYFNDGAGGFTAVSFGDDLGVAYGFATGDMDEDGVIDIAVARSDAPNVLYFGR